MKAGGIEWSEQWRGEKWVGKYSGSWVYLYRFGQRAWHCEIREATSAQSSKVGPVKYHTRREAIEGIKCVVEFMGGKSVVETGYTVYGLMTHKHLQVEGHLRAWL